VPLWQAGAFAEHSAVSERDAAEQIFQHFEQAAFFVLTDDLQVRFRN
jgi:hypothetical protein